MTIDEAYRFVKFVSNKDTRGGISPNEFNLLAPVCQIEAISDRLTNVKKVNGRLMPQYGYKANRKIITELRLLLSGPVELSVNSSMISSYPNDYFYPDSMHTDDYKRIEMIESDEYPDIKHSLIFPPDDDHPVAVFYGDFILLDPDPGVVKFNYVKYPEDPVWAYTGGSNPVYDSANSVNFTIDRSLHREICIRILKYMGINLDAQMLAEFTKVEEGSN